MGAPRKFDAETQERAVRMYRDRLSEHGDSKTVARTHVGALLDINPATIRNWVEKDEPSLETLRRETTELRSAKEILKTASAFFAAAEVDRRLR
ncbi:transposase (plasmid) [Rhodococcus erythropolis]|nr:transposase [Rhodococcus erythropolis]